jgi:V/A-type H+-transporting ATPase subunit D
MAIKFQYNKTSLHNLGKQLKMRRGALPILKNKESALRVEVAKHKQELQALEIERDTLLERAETLYPFMSKFPFSLVKLERLETGKRKIAGVIIPVFVAAELQFDDTLWHQAPSWFADVLHYLGQLTILNVKVNIASRQLAILERERKRTTQKVNLYEKVQIPELEDAMKRVKRFLEDEQNLSKAAQKMVKARQQA